MCYICRVNTGKTIMFGFLNSKEVDERDTVTTDGSLGLYPEGWLSHVVGGKDPIESPINFDTLNTLTKEYYSPQARVKRMLLHAKVAAEKGSWWCNIPDVGEEEIEILKKLGLRVYFKDVDKDGGPVRQYSLNWAEVWPKDISLKEV